jgi:hypothetical protein
MAKTFRAWDVDRAWLLPPSIHDFVPAGPGAHLSRDLVREALDLRAILDADPEERGQPPYHPAMMTALLPSASSRGIDASSRIAGAGAARRAAPTSGVGAGSQARVDVMAVTGLRTPDVEGRDLGRIDVLAEDRVRPVHRDRPVTDRRHLELAQTETIVGRGRRPGGSRRRANHAAGEAGGRGGERADGAPARQSGRGGAHVSLPWQIRVAADLGRAWPSGERCPGQATAPTSVTEARGRRP